MADELKLRFLEEIRAEKSSELKKWEKEELEYAESILISSLSSVELREKMLEDIENPDSRYKIISTFDEKTMEKYIDSIKEKDLMVRLLIKTGKSDEYKQKFLEDIEDDWIKASIISSFESDELKEKCLGNIEKGKSWVIESLKSDELKEKYLEKMESPWERGRIIASFESDELKEKYLEKGEGDRAKIIASFKTDELKEKYLERMQEESLISIEEDEFKRGLEEIRIEKDMAEIIASFESDELKQIYLDGIESTSSRAIIIKEIKDDEIKSELAQKLGDIFFTTEIMATVEDEKLKREFLYTKLFPGNFLARELDSYCCDLVMSMGNYKDKERFSNMMSSFHKARVIASITGEEKDFPVEKMEYLSQKREDIHIKEEEASKRVKLLEKIEKLRSIIAEQEQEIAIGTEEKDGGEIGDNE